MRAGPITKHPLPRRKEGPYSTVARNRTRDMLLTGRLSKSQKPAYVGCQRYKELLFVKNRGSCIGVRQGDFERMSVHIRLHGYAQDPICDVVRQLRHCTDERLFSSRGISLYLKTSMKTSTAVFSRDGYARKTASLTQMQRISTSCPDVVGLLRCYWIFFG